MTDCLSRISPVFWMLLATTGPLAGQDEGAVVPPAQRPGVTPVLVDEADVAWVDLLAGDSLDGWRQLGGQAEYAVSGGVVTGRAVADTPNSFLATERMFGDFILEYEFKVDPRLNSGVQVRSRSEPSYRDGRVHGYQVEIDPSDRAWTAGIYDEGRRGWLAPLSGDDKADARAAFRQGDWNRVRVRAVGDRLQTWLNGVPAADLVDSMTLEGFIALQVHSIPSAELAGATVQWRGLRLKDLGRHSWQPILEGDDLAHWTPTPGGMWTLEDGVLTGRSPATESRHGILLSDRSFGNFTVRFEFKVDAGNSGFYFRAEPVDSAVSVHGFQAEVDATTATGGIYETGGRGWVAQPDPALIESIYRPGQWTRMTVSAHADHYVVHLDGRQVVDLVDEKGRREGRLGFQLHGGQEMDVSFRAVELMIPDARDDG